MLTPCLSPSPSHASHSGYDLQKESGQALFLKSIREAPQPPRVLDLSYIGVGNKMIYAALRALDPRTLGVLRLAGTKCDDGVLYSLGDFLTPDSPLTTLDLSQTRCTRYGLCDLAGSLAGLDQLTRLDLSHLPLQDTDIAQFLNTLFPAEASPLTRAKGRSLQRLRISHAGVGVESAKVVARMLRAPFNTLRFLDLSWNDPVNGDDLITSGLIGAISQSRLRFLNLQGIPLHPEGLMSLFNGLIMNCNLEHLSLTIFDPNSHDKLTPCIRLILSLLQSTLCILHTVETNLDEAISGLMSELDEVKCKWIANRQKAVRRFWSVSRTLLAPGTLYTSPRTGILSLPLEVLWMILDQVGMMEDLSKRVVREICSDAMAPSYKALEEEDVDQDWLLDRLDLRWV
ncbi:MAG: hypothetical protein DHS80DRAFT_29557 [Piptocephalis tieghemiana]|nr:MAG: hypothetical protein DHS80DRAFT_29557 [Piptocephalis tieghemiana]